MIRRPPRSTQSRSSAASDVYKRQVSYEHGLVALRESGEQGGDEADADTAADVPAEGGEPGDLIVFLLWHTGIAECVDGDEEEGQTDCNDCTPTDSEAEVDLLVD